MTDVSDRRREPKGIPTGGEFAKEDSGAADAADLEEAAFERAEREADEYYSSLTDEDLERQWMEESGRTSGSEADSPGLTTTEGRRDSERQRAERTGSHSAPKTSGAPEEGTKPGVDPERDRLWDALVGQHAGPQTRARLARDPRLLAVVGIDGNARPVAVMPRVITDDQSREVYAALEKLFDYGVNEALTGNLGHVFIARQAGMKVRGDFGLNAFNSYTLRVLQDAGFISATASFELRLAQIKAMAKPVDTELIIYGRLPLMVSDQCIIRQSAGRCNCQTPGQLSDRMGSVFPVVKEFGCRNVIYNAHKLYLADKRDDLYALGLWGLRMLFTTESPRECVEVAKGYLGLTDYKPNVLTRGLYYRGVD